MPSRTAQKRAKPAAAKPSSNGRTNGKPKPRKRTAAHKPIEVSIVTDEQRAEGTDRLLAGTIGGLDDQEIRLDFLLKANEHKETDIVPDPQMGGVTYTEVREQIADQRKRILAVFGEKAIERAKALAKRP